MWDDPRVQDIQQNRVSTGSIQTVSTLNSVDTRASSVVPAASHNLGKSEEELQEMSASETGAAYLGTKAGRTAAEKLNNTPLPEEEATAFNKEMMLIQNKEYKAKREQRTQAHEKVENQKLRKQRMLKFLLVFAILAVVGGVVGVLMSNIESAALVSSPNDTPNPTTEEPTQSPNAEPTNVITEAPTSPTKSPETPAPVPLPTQTISQQPTSSPESKQPTESPTLGPTIAPSTSPSGTPTFIETRAIDIVSPLNDPVFLKMCQDYDKVLNDNRNIALCKSSTVAMQCNGVSLSTIETCNKGDIQFCEKTGEVLQCTSNAVTSLVFSALRAPILLNLFSHVTTCIENNNFFSACIDNIDSTAFFCFSGESNIDTCSEVCNCDNTKLFSGDVCLASQENECADLTAFDFAEGTLESSLATIACPFVTAPFEPVTHYCEQKVVSSCSNGELVPKDNCLPEACLCERTFFIATQTEACATTTVNDCNGRNDLHFSNAGFEIMDKFVDFKANCEKELLPGRAICVGDSLVAECVSAQVEVHQCSSQQICSCEEQFKALGGICIQGEIQEGCVSLSAEPNIPIAR